MGLPLDPETLTSEDIGEHSTDLEMTHSEAIAHVRSVAESVGFGVPVEFSPAELLNEKVDANRDPYYVLGACNPTMADRALSQSLRMGSLFPCNFVIWEIEPNLQRVYHVSIMRIARLVGIVPDSTEMESIVQDTGELVEAFFDQV